MGKYLWNKPKLKFTDVNSQASKKSVIVCFKKMTASTDFLLETFGQTEINWEHRKQL